MSKILKEPTPWAVRGMKILKDERIDGWRLGV